MVVDANLTIALVISLPYSAKAEALWNRWDAEAIDLYAPDLWAYEVTSALRKAIVLTGMPHTSAENCLDALMELGVHLVPPTLELNRLALQWAGRLGHTVAYDAHYLALAETLGCPFWTSDRRLANSAKPDAPWVHSLDEFVP